MSFTRSSLAALLALVAATCAARGEDAAPPPSVARKLADSLAELAAVRQEIANQKIPMSAKLSGLENEQIEARKAYESVKRQLDARTLDMNNLRNEIKSREQEKSYLSSLLGEYIRNLETRLHIAELSRYQAAIEEARMAPEDANLKAAEVFATQAALVEASLGRLEELKGGVRFAGRAAGDDGMVKPGAFVLLGPVAYFASDDGSLAGVAEQRLGSLEPSAEKYADPLLDPMTRALVANGRGMMPLDGSLGNARKVEETRETLVEHIGKGGAVMWPILALAGAVVLLSLFKWIVLSLVHIPDEKSLSRLFKATGSGDLEAARRVAKSLRGPVGAMLRTGAEHLGESKELIEEVMLERMLDTRFRFHRGLPFIAVGAACAPLLGLLGTVTGIIGTFKMITIFGSGDIKMLSSGISEALITTEFGLYAAIPSLLFHAFLSRKAKALLDRMERLAISFLTEVTRGRTGTAV